jgi:hypothetical protein
MVPGRFGGSHCTKLPELEDVLHTYLKQDSDLTPFPSRCKIAVQDLIAGIIAPKMAELFRER